MWNDADGYEAYVGRWSRIVARPFVEWIGAAPGRRWVDVACGTGAVTTAILERTQAASVIGIDSSAAYLAAAAAGPGVDLRARFEQADAAALPLPDRSVDVVVCGLAWNFLPFARALAEQRRILRDDGLAGGYVWDYAGEYEFARRFWDAATRVDDRAASYDPGRGGSVCSLRTLASGMTDAGFTDIATTAFDASGTFRSREAYWACFDGRQGSTAAYLALLTETQRLDVRDALYDGLPPSGPITLKVRALAVKGRVAGGVSA